MKCSECGGKLKKTVGDHKYVESGLDNIVLVNIPIYHCQSCKEKEVGIPKIKELHLMIAFLILFKSVRLNGAEARYLRKHLGYTAEDLADKFGVKRVTVARWESEEKSIGLVHDKQLRQFYFKKKAIDWGKMPQIQKIVAGIMDYLPLEKTNPKFKLHAEDWTSFANA